jgi:myo-inositol-1(or 4)-monophosphatase
VDDRSLLEVLDRAAQAIRQALGELGSWGLAGTKPGQYLSDLAADEAALEVFAEADLGVLSEESGRHRPDADVTVVLDPLDGSTNASRGIPWFATSLCAVDAKGPRAALVVNLATGQRFDAVRGGGARCDGRPISPSEVTRTRDSVVLLSGFPRAYLGWSQYRALGACALDLCAVASGAADAYLDCSVDAHGSWDYLAGVLVCQEAGATVVDALGRDLLVLDHAARRTPLAASTPELRDQLLQAHRSLKDPSG